MIVDYRKKPWYCLIFNVRNVGNWAQRSINTDISIIRYFLLKILTLYQTNIIKIDIVQIIGVFGFYEYPTNSFIPIRTTLAYTRGRKLPLLFKVIIISDAFRLWWAISIKYLLGLLNATPSERRSPISSNKSYLLRMVCILLHLSVQKIRSVQEDKNSQETSQTYALQTAGIISRCELSRKIPCENLTIFSLICYISRHQSFFYIIIPYFALPFLQENRHIKTAWLFAHLHNARNFRARKARKAAWKVRQLLKIVENLFVCWLIDLQNPLKNCALR